MSASDRRLLPRLKRELTVATTLQARGDGLAYVLVDERQVLHHACRLVQPPRLDLRDVRGNNPSLECADVLLGKRGWDQEMGSGGAYRTHRVSILTCCGRRSTAVPIRR